MENESQNPKMLFVLYLYEKENAQGQFEHSTEFQVLATSEEEAVAFAKRYQPNKENYHIKAIVDPELVIKK